MIEQRPVWKYTLVALVVLLGAIYVFPDFLSKGATVVIQSRLKTDISPEFKVEMQSILAVKKIKFRTIEVNGKHLFISFSDTASQIKAVAALEKVLEKKVKDYIVFQIMEPSTIQWTASKGTKPLDLGLESKGGIHALMDIDFAVVIANRVSRYQRELRKNFIKKSMPNKGVRKFKEGLRIEFSNDENRMRVAAYLDQFYQGFKLTKSESEGAYYIEAVLSEHEIANEQKVAITKNVQIMSRRIYEMGIDEFVLIRQGSSRIIINLPGVDKSEKLVQIISSIGIQSRPVSPENNAYIIGGYRRGEPPPIGTEVIKHREMISVIRPVTVTKNGKKTTILKRVRKVREQAYLVSKEVTWSGKNVINAVAGYSTGNGPSNPALHITLDDAGGARNRTYARKNLNKRAAIVVIESASSLVKVDGKLRRIIKRRKKIINVAFIRSPDLYKRFEISGMNTPGEARKLAMFLRTGILAASMNLVGIRTVRPGS